MEQSNSIYQYYKQNPIQGGNLTITNAQQVISFPIPQNKVINWNKAYVTYSLVKPANTNCIVMAVDKPPFDAVSLNFGGGAAIVDIKNLGIWWKPTVMATTPLDEYIGNDPCFANTTAATALGLSEYCQPAKTINAATAGTALTATSAYVTSASARTVNAAFDALGGHYDYSYARQHVIVRTAAEAAAARFKVPLGRIAHTYFSLNQNSLFGDLQGSLDITLSPLNTFMYKVAAVTDIAGTPTAVAEDLVMSNLALWLPIEQNKNNVQAITEAFNRGMTLNVPMPEIIPSSVGQATSYSVTVPLNVMKGQSLLRVYNICAMTSNTGVLQTNIENVAGIKLTSFQEALDSDFIQKQPVVISTDDDYMLNKSWLMDSALGLDSREYRINWCQCSDFSGVSRSIDWKYSDNKPDGFDLTKPGSVSYSFSAVLPGTYSVTLYTCPVYSVRWTLARGVLARAMNAYSQ